MKKATAKRITDKLIDSARIDYAMNDLLKDLDDPAFIQDKKTALTVCRMYVHFMTDPDRPVMKEGSIGHKLGLRLADYIKRTGKE